MSPQDLDGVIAAAMRDRRLLDHPFYRRWETGEVSISELASYAAQYRYFENYLPSFLAGLTARLPEGSARDLVAANLADELGDPLPHVELFERFADAVEALAETASRSDTASRAESASPATQALLVTYERLLAQSPLAALAGFVAYECQASEIAERKADGLRRHYGLGDDAVSFWEHHARVDVQHGEWSSRALGESADTPGQLAPFMRQAADAWWGFLDEREAVVQV